ncbi:MAG TPA: acyl CoA--acetate/3-ketoacid CoA transferase subunit beta [Proteobacteria bacterium]|nr:glutaconate CoA-transferase subunit B [bacterium BMS3Abin14]HDL53101.1 acyl CoA--acetate/3-ketoacid CoA transferase subunit beta [Pseudomonadota bacterium]
MSVIRQDDPKAWTHVDDTEYEAYCKEKGIDPEKYTTMELLAIAAARQTYDYSFIFAGTGLPMIGCMMAQHTYAPNALIIMEAGILDPKLIEVPISVSEARGGYQCSTLSNMADTFGTFAQRGFCTFGMLGGAECDKYGNLNSTCMGGYYSKSARDDGKPGPAVRFAGSGGANPIASYSDVGLAMMVQEKRRFPEKCDFLTSPTGSRGKIGTSEDRWHYGLFRGGATTIVSDLAIFRSNPDTGELELAEIYPGVDEQLVKDNVSWDLKKAKDFSSFVAPQLEEIKIARMVCDPNRIYLGRKTKRDLAAEK